MQRNIKLYEAMHEEFSQLLTQKDKILKIAYFWRTVALDEPQLLADWEPRNKTQLACEHLASYFEEKCYWTAKDLCNGESDSWEEYFFMARLLIYNPLKLSEILAKYNNSYNANLETYVSQILINTVKFSAEVNRFSRWRLLYKKSDKELKEALKVLGIVDPELTQIIFSRKYFKQVYLMNKVKNPARSTGKKWVAPDEEDFSKSAQCYNVEKALPTTPHEVFANSSNVTAKQIKDWMEICIKSLENYPKSILPKFSLDALQSDGFEARSESQTEIVNVEWQGILANEDIRDSRDYLVKKVNSVLSEKLQAMKPDNQKILLLYYGFGLNQKQLAARLKINQSTISRYLTKSTIQLLETLAGVSQSQQWVKQYVEKWLCREYKAPVHSDLVQAALVSAIKKLTSEEREIFQLYYGQKIDKIKIAEQLNVKIDEITKRLNQAQNQLQENLMQEINIWIKEYLEKWLSKYYQSLVKSVLKTVSNSGNQEVDIEEKISLLETYIQNQY
ncbi:sigma-70 family RNA polymerase sigma factor [Scytonema hofmannii]|uniref:sigma-70 family RNA polymerase sigma factor n=1 Tax=Scytonema hofmannii TaxID=34078 RepID=UPI00191C7FD7|nr:sigma-70 family RNA polymerase sigma factor [Scytonema hofmannii]